MSETKKPGLEGKAKMEIMVIHHYLQEEIMKLRAKGQELANLGVKAQALLQEEITNPWNIKMEQEEIEKLAVHVKDEFKKLIGTIPEVPASL